MAVDCSNYFPLTLQDILNPDLSFIFGKMQAIKNIPDFRVSYYSGRTIGEGQPQCVGCDTPFTVRHFLLEYGDFAQVRNNCIHVENMKQLFQDIHIDSIMTFLRQINIFNKI